MCDFYKIKEVLITPAGVNNKPGAKNDPGVKGAPGVD